jgi:hypothetical protein
MRRRVWIVVGIVAVFAVIGAPSCGPSAAKQQAAKQQAAKHDAHTTSVHDGGKAHTSLYDKAAGAEPPAYRVVYATRSRSSRVDAWIVTAKTGDKAKLGAILIHEQQRTGADLYVAGFAPNKAALDSGGVFAYGQLAATAKGKAYMSGRQDLSKVGKVPYMSFGGGG